MRTTAPSKDKAKLALQITYVAHLDLTDIPANIKVNSIFSESADGTFLNLLRLAFFNIYASLVPHILFFLS